MTGRVAVTDSHTNGTRCFEHRLGRLPAFFAGWPDDGSSLVVPGDGGEASLNYRRFYGHAQLHLERMGSLVRAGGPPGAIMGELAAAEHHERRR